MSVTHNYHASYLPYSILLVFGKRHHSFIYKPTSTTPSWVEKNK